LLILALTDSPFIEENNPVILTAGNDRLNLRVFDPQTTAQKPGDHQPELHQPIAFKPFKHGQKPRQEPGAKPAAPSNFPLNA
jgi:hypothetical protein